MFEKVGFTVQTCMSPIGLYWLGPDPILRPSTTTLDNFSLLAGPSPIFRPKRPFLLGLTENTPQIGLLYFILKL